MNILEKVGDLLVRRRMERLQADLVNVNAKADYIAMMTDTDIPTEEGSENDVV